jgi:hypothetical protein
VQRTAARVPVDRATDDLDGWADATTVVLLLAAL